MPRILLEGDVVSEFIPDRTKLTEELADVTRRGPIKIPGKFSLSDSVNGNNRRYPKRVWEKNLQPGSTLMGLVEKKRSLGLLEHPKDGVVTLNSPISHLVTSVRMEGQEVSGEITLIRTAEGNKMAALIEAGYNPFVSSRGYGSVVKGNDGVDEVQDDFVCESWDLVANPSFKIAELQPQRESLAEGTPKQPTPLPKSDETPEQLFARINGYVNEGKIRASSVKLLNGQVVLEGEPAATVTVTSTGGVATTKVSTPAVPVPAATNTRDTMDIKTIRESVNSLRTIDVSKLDPRQLAEGLTQMQSLHREASAIVAQDPKASYDVRMVDRDLDSLEQAWTESAKAPAATVTKLQEQQVRTVKVLKAVCETGIKTRTKLQESVKLVARKEALLAEVAKRGNDWRRRALTAESRLKLRESRLNLTYASLDEFAKRYHEDTAKLARHALMVEHGAKINADAALLKRVNEAKRVEPLLLIKEEIEGKKLGSAIIEGAPAAAPAAPAPGAPAKVAPAAPAAAAPAANPPAAPAVRVESTVRPFSVSQIMECNTRLSAASLAG